MRMVPVKSSNIKAVGYDPATLTMHVQFASGATYAHEKVVPARHEGFMKAASKGAHYAAQFKGKHSGKVGAV